MVQREAEARLELTGQHGGALAVEHGAAREPTAEHLQRRARRPRRRPRRNTIASATSWMLPATMSWLAALTVWPEPAGPTWTIGLADRVEHRPGRREVVGRTAHHDRQTGLDRARLAAADRSVEHTQARGPTRLRHPYGDVRPDRAHVDVERALRGRWRRPRRVRR